MQIQRRDIISAEIACSGANKTDTFTRVKKTKNIWAWAKKIKNLAFLQTVSETEQNQKEMTESWSYCVCVCVCSEITCKMLS